MGLRSHGHFQSLGLFGIAFLIFTSTFARAENVSDDALVKLARAQVQFHFDSLEPEQKEAFDTFFLKVHQGEDANFSPKGSRSQDVAKDVAKGDSWGPRRTVEAAWIRWLCKDPDAVKMVQPLGIEIEGAKIDGKVGLVGLSMQFPLEATACYFTDGIYLEWANVRALRLLDSHLASSSLEDWALDLSFANIGAGVDLRSTSATGGVSLNYAEIRGTLDCTKAIVAGGIHRAFSGEWMKVTGDVWFSDSIAGGEIRIARATIGGNLVCRRAKISSEPALLDATRATIVGNVIIGTDIGNYGTLSFFAANIGGTFELSNSESSQKAILDLRDANAKVLLNEEKSWPKPNNLQLQGFVFSELGGGASLLVPKTQIKWLRLQSPFVAQPYEQMATVFRNMGYEGESVKVSIAEKWDEGLVRFQHDFGSIVSLSWAIGRDGILWRYGKAFVHGWELVQAVLEFLFYDVLWFFFFGWMIQYGYRPWNALFISFGFIFIGTMAFRFAAEKEILVKKDNSQHGSPAADVDRHDRNFSAFIYSLETFVPLVNLGIAQNWRIDANVIRPVQLGNVMLREPGKFVLCYYWMHIIAGWVFTSLWVAAFTGILKR